MKAFRVGYTLTTAFILIIAGAFLTLGFYSAPVAPKAPAYPTYPANSGVITQSTTIAPGNGTGTLQAPNQNTYYNNQNPQLADYQTQLTKYQNDQKQYQEDIKNFTETKTVPYLRNVLVIWIILLVLAQIFGVLLARFGMELAGGALSFTGIYGVIFGPFWSLIIVVSSFASALSASTSNAQSLTGSYSMLTQSLGLAGLLGGLILVIAGATFEKSLFPSMKGPTPQVAR